MTAGAMTTRIAVKVLRTMLFVDAIRSPYALGSGKPERLPSARLARGYTQVEDRKHISAGRILPCTASVRPLASECQRKTAAGTRVGVQRQHPSQCKRDPDHPNLHRQTRIV